MGLEVFDHYECDGQMEIEGIAPKRRLTHLSLFSGIGGLDLAAEWAGFESVGQCEFADYPTKILERHWPDVPRWRDIRTLTGADFYGRTGLRTVDVISGGFPCQPFSTAGKQRGEDDDRYLWPEMVRVIAELWPTWVVGENVAGIINMALDKVLSDLEGQGYATRTFLIPACGVNAPHQRYRTAIVAHSNRIGQLCGEPEIIRTESGKPTQSESIGCCEVMADTTGEGLEGNAGSELQGEGDGPSSGSKDICNRTEQPNCNRGEPDGFRQWAFEPNVGRVADGIPNRVDRIKCLGNAVVPQQFYPIFQAIAEIEMGTKTRI